MILLPTPKQLEVFEEKFVLRYDAYIVLEDGCSPPHRRQAFCFKKIEGAHRACPAPDRRKGARWRHPVAL